MAKSGAAANAVTSNMQQNLLNSINASGKFQASFKTIATTTESFTRSLEKNQLSMGQYFKYAGASTKTFGKLFRSEFDTINKVARERVKDLQTQYIKLGRDANGAMKAISVRPLTLDMKNLGTQTQIAAQRQQLLNQLLKQGSTNLLNFGKNTQWAGRQLMVGFTVPLAMLGSAAAKTFMQLEEQALRFKRVYGDSFTTAEETTKVLKDLEQLAKGFTRYGVSVEETMKMAADAAAMGKMGADLTAQVAQATRLAVLGGVEQTQALETTISVTNAFGVATEDLAKKIDFLNAVENQTVVSIEDLTIAIPKAGPVVQQLGGDVEDLAFFLTAMKEGGINASEGANALKSGLAALINPTEKASAMLQGFGININAIVEGNMGNVKQTVIDFASALDTLDPLNRARAIEQLFGKFQFSRLSTLFQNVIGEGTQASRVLELTMSTQEELAILSERELKRIEDSTGYKFKAAIESLKVSLAPVGEEFLKALTPVVEFVGNILERFNNLGDGTKKFVVILTAILGGIGPILLMSFGLLANGIANIIKLFTSVKTVFNRAGQSSQVLGQQTDYMTQEQIQAATVAASLEQVHTKLIQTFTAEATAVQALATAYKNAVAAQLAFTGPVGRGAPKRQGLNRGTTKVKYYAKGTDTVPAMLTPGEAVIPAGAAQNPKNKPAIATMVAGGVVGYAGGTVNVGSQGYGLTGGTQSTMAAIQRKIDSSLGQIDDIIAQALQNLAGETKITIKKFQDQVRAIAKEKGVSAGPAFAKKYETRTKSYNAKAAGVRGSAEDQLIRERGKPAAAAEMARVNAAAKAIEQELRKFGATSSQIANAIQIDRSHVVNVDNEQKKLLQAWDSNLWTAQTGAENNAILDTLRKSQKSNQRIFNTYKEYLVQTGATTEQINGIVANITKGVALTDEQMSIQGKALRAMGAEAAKSEKARIALEKRSTKNFVMYAAAVGEGQLAREKVMASESAETKKLIVRNKKKIQEIVNELPNAAAVELQTKSPSRKMRKVGQDAGRGIVLGAKEFVDDAKIVGQQIGASATDGLTQGGRTRRVATRAQGPAPIGVPAPAGVNLLPIVAGDPKPQPKGRIGTYLANRAEKREAAGKTGMGAGGAMMGASGAMMAASMIPGQVGEAAQKLMMPMLGLSMILPLLQSKLGLAAVAVGLVVGAMYYFNESLKKAREEGIALANAMSMGSEKIKALSVIAGTVSASESASRQRETMLSGATEEQRKFGQNILGSEFGKTIVSDVEKQAKSGIDAKQIAKNISLNLAQSVMQGVITTEQAKSIASALGEKLGDYEIPALISGNLVSLLGPNGENLYADPLEIALKIKADSFQNVKENFELALAGANANAVQKSLPGWKKALDFLAAGVGGSMPFAQNELASRNAALDAGAVQSGVRLIELNQATVDSLNKQYAIKIQNAKTEKESLDLEAQRKKAIDEVNSANKVTLEQVKTLSEGMSSKDFSKAINASIDSAYADADSSTKSFIKQTQDSLNSLSDSPFKTTLQLGFASKDLSNSTINKLLNATAEDKTLESRVNVLIQEEGFANTELLYQLLTKTGADAKTVSLMINYVNKNKKDFDTDIEAVQALSEFNKTYGVQLNLKTTGTKQILTATNALYAIKDLPEKLDLKLVTKLAGENPAIFGPIKDNWNALSEGKDTINKNLVVNYSVGKGDPNVIAAASAEYAGKGFTQNQATATYLQKGFVAPPPPAPAGGGSVPSGGGKGPDASSLDELVKKLKEVQKNQIKVTVGYGASMKALKAFAATGKTMPFSGIEQDIMKMKGANVGTNFLEFILGMDPKEYEKKKKDIFKFDNKGNITGLAKDGKVIRTILESITAGEFQAGILKQKNELEDQNAAFTKLRNLGVPVSEAYELITNAAFANMIATAKNKDKVKQLIDEYKRFLALQKETENTKAFDLKLDGLEKVPQTVSDQQVAIANLMSQGASYAAAYAFVEDATVAATVAGTKNEEVLKRIATAAALAEEATRKFGVQQQFNAKIKDFTDTLENLTNQRIAITKLVGLGFSYAESYSMVQDAAVAATIAQTTNNKVIIETGNLAKKTATELKNMSAAMGIVNLNQQTQDRTALLAFIKANKGALSNDVIKALLENSELATLMLNPSIDPAALEQALKDAANAATLELEMKKLTIEGMEQIFNDGFSKAMEAFDAEEKAIQLKFAIDNKSLIDIEEGIIPIAESAIAALQYQIDDWEAGLKDIEDQEKNINDTYEDKFKALDQVQRINEKIARQQKQQLTLADALSQGDISAAAVAIQEMRASNAADQVGVQRESLEAAKENQLANVRNALGQTRKQIEDQIKKLKDEIFKIEEKTLEPARERLRLNERERDIQISNITVLGRTKAEWEGVKNGIDLARTRSDEYKVAIQAALDIVKDIVDYWTNKVPAKKTTIHEIITSYVQKGSLADCCAGPPPPPDPKGDGGCTGTPTTFVQYRPCNGNVVQVTISVDACGKETYDCPGAADPEVPKLTYCPSLGRNVPTSGFPGNCPGAEATTTTTTTSTKTVVPKDTTPTVKTCPPGQTLNKAGECVTIPPLERVVTDHLDDLGIIAQNAAANLVLFNQAMNVATVTKTAGSTAGMHLGELYDMQNNLVVQKAMAPTPGMLAQEAAVKAAAEKTAALAQKAKDNASADAARAAQAKKDAAAAKAKADAKRAADLKAFGGNAAAANAFANWGNNYSGGLIKRFAVGGRVIGTDTVPSMLTPGEFIVSRPAVREYGVDKLKAINSQAYDDSAVYNYNLSVNMSGSDLDADDVATVVLQKIKQLDSQRIRRQ
jgi:TP901 family phage tail tape measure protein